MTLKHSTADRLLHLGYIRMPWQEYDLDGRSQSLQVPCFRWGEAFITELMAGSKKRPLLSGYYRLMEMALQLYSQSGRLIAETQFGQVIDVFGEGPTSSVLLSCRRLFCVFHDYLFATALWLRAVRPGPDIRGILYDLHGVFRQMCVRVCRL